MEVVNNVLEPECYYHIYNRAVGGELLSQDENDYQTFFIKYNRFVGKLSDLYSYCLIPNHFHILIRIKSEEELVNEFSKPINDWNAEINQRFSNFFNSYTKTYNKYNNRKGKLFMLPYKRGKVDNDEYLGFAQELKNRI